MELDAFIPFSKDITDLFSVKEYFYEDIKDDLVRIDNKYNANKSNNITFKLKNSHTALGGVFLKYFITKSNIIIDLISLDDNI